MDSKIKKLLLVVNKLGVEMNYETITKYSKQFNTLKSEYHLKVWYKIPKKDPDNEEEKQRYYCKDKEFYRLEQVAKYLIAIKEDLENATNET